jgi:hypothetical protein
LREKCSLTVPKKFKFEQITIALEKWILYIDITKKFTELERSHDSTYSSFKLYVPRHLAEYGEK